MGMLLNGFVHALMYNHYWRSWTRVVGAPSPNNNGNSCKVVLSYSHMRARTRTYFHTRTSSHVRLLSHFRGAP